MRGVTFDADDSKDRPDTGTIPILRAGNIGDDLIVDRNLVWVPAARVDVTQLIRRGDIAICMSSGSSEVVGKTARAVAARTAAVGAFCGLIRPNDPLVGRYLAHFFRSEPYRRWRDGIARGANIQNLRFSELEKLDVKIPADPIVIVNRLDSAAHLVRMYRHALEMGEGLLGAVFLEMFGDPARNANQYEVVELGEIATQVTDGEHATPVRQPSGIKLLSARNIKNGFIDLTPGVDYIGEAEFERIRRRCWPRPGDILISCSGSIGRVTIVRVDEPLSMVRSAALVKPALGKVFPDYLESALQTDALQRQMTKAAHQSSQANLFIGPIKELKVPLPKLSVQERFVHRAAEMRRMRAVQVECLRQAEHLFQTLLHEAFGEGR